MKKIVTVLALVLSAGALAGEIQLSDQKRKDLTEHCSYASGEECFRELLACYKSRAKLESKSCKPYIKHFESEYGYPSSYKTTFKKGK